MTSCQLKKTKVFEMCTMFHFQKYLHYTSIFREDSSDIKYFVSQLKYFSLLISFVNVHSIPETFLLMFLIFVFLRSLTFMFYFSSIFSNVNGLIRARKSKKGYKIKFFGHYSQNPFYLPLL